MARDPPVTPPGDRLASRVILYQLPPFLVAISAEHRERPSRATICPSPMAIESSPHATVNKCLAAAPPMRSGSSASGGRRSSTREAMISSRKPVAAGCWPS
jgi:hypothetical protein